MTELKEAKTNMIAGSLSALFSIGFFLETYRFRVVDVINSIDARFMPRITAVMVFICSILLFFKGFNAYKIIPRKERLVKDTDRKKTVEGLVRCGKVFMVMFITSVFFKRLGFLLIMPPTMFALFTIIEKKEKRKYKLYLLLSIVSPVLVFLVFYYGFTTLLPMGILKPLLNYL